MPGIVVIEITKPLPEKAVVDSIYRIEGSVKLLDAVGAPPFVYAKIRRKEWYKPEVAEEVSYERGWPVPGTGNFSIEFKPEKEGEYKVSIVATPAPLALPVAGVFPVLAESDVMEVAVGEKPPAVFRFSGVTIDGNSVALTDHDADSGLLIQKTTADFLEVIPAFEWVGPKKSATISIKAGYRDLVGGFSPKTDAYTRTFELPESPDIPYPGALEEPIKIPLTACGDLDDGAIEIVAKLPDMPDYITHIWNVYATKPPVVTFRFSTITIDGNEVPLTNHDADSELLLEKTTADHLNINPAFEWQGSRKTAKISIKAGYKDWTGAFSPKTDAYTRTIELPESIETIYPGQLTTPITVPLIACGGLTDGAIEVVLKIADVPDYITHIWNVYATKVPPEELDFDLAKPTVAPAEIVPGASIAITCPVTSACTKEQVVTAKIKIYEGSIYAGHGTLITTKTSPAFSIVPGQAYDVIVHHTAIAGTIDRRDVEVEVYVGGELVKESEWDDVYYVEAPAEVLDFDLTRPTASPSQVTPGATVTITCPVTSRCTKVQSVTAKVLIYEGSIYAGHGALITTKTVNFSISPNQTYNASISHTAIAGTIDRRDVEVEVYVGGKLIKESEWDDVYYVKVPEEVIDFSLTKPTASPFEVTPGATVTITCPVTSKCTKSQSVTAKVLIYEGSIYAGHGALLDTKTVNFSISPNQTYNASISHTAIAGTIDRRDVEVEVYVGGKLIKESEWDDVYYVKQVVEEYTLTITIDPPGGGTVTKSPDKTKYTYGEFVTLTATPSSGYKFDRWSGDASGYSTPITIAMTRDKSVTARFKAATPDPTTIVSFTVKGDGFPFLTSYWKLYHYDRDGNVWQDYTLHRPGDIINVRNVKSAGKLSCHCVSAVTGEWSEQFYSVEFAAIGGEDYKYDIASGIVYYR